jgi:hypothetical protein
MTIDEAIKHCIEVAEENEELSSKFDEWDEWEKADANNCRECAADHRQLAEWLTELKKWQENPFRQIRIKCKENYDCTNCTLFDHCLQDEWYGYPMEWDLY